MLKVYRADLHIHSCLSPCADIDMTPARVVSRAVEKGLDIIAITDHNTAENIPAALNIRRDIAVIPGIEITTSEEAHILALFSDVKSALKLQDIVYNDLPLTNERSIICEQIVVNDNDEVIRFNDRMLIDATRFEAKDTIKLINDLGGLAIACHIDREVFSILTQIGFIPDSLKFDALEISFRTKREKALKMFSEYKRFPWITSSDAHHLEGIGRAYTEFLIKEPTFKEIVLALSAKDGRIARF